MDVFLFEYITSGGLAPEEIVVEGLGMFKSLYTGFNRFSVGKISYFIKPSYSNALSLPACHNLDLDFSNLDEVIDEIKQRVEEYAERSDCSLIIAPEDDGILLELTKIVEKRSENLGSSSKGIAIAADKWETYKKLRRKVNVPLTSEKPLKPPFVLKPRTSCGGEGIEVVESQELEIKPGFIAQELVKGENLSVSLIVGDETNVLSVNRQVISDFKYMGAEVPAQLRDDDFKLVLEESTRAVECIKGLHGYVGVDIVLAEVPYVIEINARFTTPSIIFDRVYGINMAELVFRNHYGGLNADSIESIQKFQNPFRLEKIERNVHEKNRNEKVEAKRDEIETIVEHERYALVCRRLVCRRLTKRNN